MYVDFHSLKWLFLIIISIKAKIAIIIIIIRIKIAIIRGFRVWIYWDWNFRQAEQVQFEILS